MCSVNYVLFFFTWSCLLNTSWQRSCLLQNRWFFHSSYLIHSIAVIFSTNRSQQTFLKVRNFFLTLINTEFEMMETFRAHCPLWRSFWFPVPIVTYGNIWVRAHLFCSAHLCPPLKTRDKLSFFILETSISVLYTLYFSRLLSLLELLCVELILG